MCGLSKDDADYGGNAKVRIVLFKKCRKVRCPHQCFLKERFSNPEAESRLDISRWLPRKGCGAMTDAEGTEEQLQGTVLGDNDISKGLAGKLR